MATIRNVISYVDAIKPNAFDEGVKVQWVNEVEGYIQTEVMMLALADTVQYDPDVHMDTVLLVKPPHDKLYPLYLCALVDFANGEYDKYNNTMQLYNKFLGEYIKWYTRVFHPADGGCVREGYYLSAYTIATRHGFEGTEEEWLESLKGDPGEPFEYDDFTQEQLEALRGPAGRDIVSVERTSGDGTAGSVDTYTITYSSGPASEFEVRNGSNGITPHIGVNGNWYIGDTDTGVFADGGDIFLAVYGETAFDAVKAAYDAGKYIYVINTNQYAPLSVTNGTTLFRFATVAGDVTRILAVSQAGGWSTTEYAILPASHNTDPAAHQDIRTTLAEMSARLNAFFDSDDQTLDELSEIVEYIKSNKTLIDSITTSKVSVSDIVDNLTTNVSSRPLSAAQGVVLNMLIENVRLRLEDIAQNGGGGGGITQETDPTVPDWAKQPEKPTYTASEVGALPAFTKIPAKTSDLQNDSGFITAAVNALLNYYKKSETYTRTEVDAFISGLDRRLNAVADSDDTTLDQLSEIVAYIKSNKSLIDSITTSKVSVSDIVNNLTTADAKKPLSAAQGKELKALYDNIRALYEAIVIPTKLPNPYSLTFTGAATGTYDGSSAVTINIPTGGGSSLPDITEENEGDVLSVVNGVPGWNPIPKAFVQVELTKDESGYVLPDEWTYTALKTAIENGTLVALKHNATLFRYIGYDLVENGPLAFASYKSGGYTVLAVSIYSSITVNEYYYSNQTTEYIRAYTSDNVWQCEKTFAEIQELVDRGVRCVVRTSYADGDRREYQYAGKLDGKEHLFTYVNSNNIYMVKVADDGTVSSTYAALAYKARKINGHTLEADFNLTAKDVGAVSTTTSEDTEGMILRSVGGSAVWSDEVFDEETKTEIVNAVLDALPTWEGGNF